MENKQISPQEARAFLVFATRKQEWLDSYEVAKLAEVSPRSARLYCLRFAKAGIIEKAMVAPKYHYRFTAEIAARSMSYMNRLIFACEVFGLELPAAA